MISVYGDGDGSGTYTDNEASPITLQEVTTSGAPVDSLVLPQSASGANNAISGEYGSSSEGTLERSVNGQFLTIAGYGVTASTYDADPQGYGGGTKSCISSGNSAVTCYPLAQTSSIPGSAATTVSRVVALIGANGSVDTSTALTNVFSGNNPRSVATVDGSSFYISGQGASKNMGDPTQGVFLAARGATTATSIDNSYDARTVQIVNNQLYVSADTTEGSGVHESISSYGATLPTSAASATVLPNLKSKFTTTSLSTLNTVDNTDGDVTAGAKIYLSPENFFFANASTLYVADSGNPKGDNNGKSGNGTQGLSDGGLQKWSLVNGNWTLDYTLSEGLDLVPDTTSCGSNQVDCGTTGLIGLTGEVVGDSVELFATNATLGDLDQTYLYGIVDDLSDTLPSQVSGETFSVLDTAAPDTNIRGVAFAPVPEPASLPLLATGVFALLATLRRRHV